MRHHPPTLTCPCPECCFCKGALWCEKTSAGWDIAHGIEAVEAPKPAPAQRHDPETAALLQRVAALVEVTTTANGFPCHRYHERFGSEAAACAQEARRLLTDQRTPERPRQDLSTLHARLEMLVTEVQGIAGAVRGMVGMEGSQ